MNETALLRAELDSVMRLTELSSRLLHCDNLEEALQETLAAAIELTGAGKGNAQLLTDDGSALEIVAQRGFDEPFLSYFKRVEVEHGCSCARAMTWGERVIVEDVRRDPIFAETLHIMEAAGCRAVQSTPLFGRSGQMLGILSTHYAEVHRPSERELRVLDLYARQAADVIEHKKQEAALRNSLNQFASVVNQSTVGVAQSDFAGRLIFVNDRYCEIAGRSRAELLGKRMQDITHPDDVPRAEPLLEELLLTGKPFTIQKRYLRPDGGQVWVHNSVTPIHDAQGRISGRTVVSVDITERVEMEEALREREARYRALFEETLDAIMIVDDDGVYVSVNRAAADMVGYTPEELIGKSITEISAMDEEQVWPLWRRFLELGRVRGDYRLKKRDGTLIDTDFHAVANVFPGRHMSTMRDITERKRHQRRITFQARLLDTVGQAILAADPDGTISYWNRAAENLYGWTGDEAIGRSVQELVPPRAALEAAAMLERVCAGSPWSGECLAQCKEGTKPIILTLTPIADAAGGVTGVIGVAVEISELKQTQKALQEAHRRKDEFLATLSHELRNPLAAIRMAAHYLQRGGEPQNQREMADVIDRQSSQLVRLIDDLLDVSRITRGKIGLRRRRIELAPIVAQALEGIRAECEASAIALAADVPQQPIVVHADAVRLGQVIGNLLHNACKYTPRGGQIWLSVERTADEAIIRVRDDGVGIAPHQQRQLFEMFSQIDPGSDRAQSGLGIGLALSKRLIEMHGGTVMARSEGLGRGSEFSLHLPLVRSESGQEAAGEASVVEIPERAPAPAAPTSSRRILVVEDNPDTLHALVWQLRATGHEVVAAANGGEALDEAEKHRPQVVLLDIGLPGVDGYEVARHIRAQPWGREIKIVAITGWGQEEDKRLAAAAGIDVHLTKPADMDVIEREVAAVIIDPVVEAESARG